MMDHDQMREEVKMARRRFVKDPEEPFCVLDAKGILVDADPSLATMLGYELDEIIGQALLEFVHEEDAEKVMQEIVSFRRSNQDTFHLENRLVKKDGSHVWIHWTAVGDFETGNAYAVARDISKERTLQVALQEALKSAERANKAKSEFLANMSHEIRTPLNAIIGMTELILDSELSPKMQDMVSTIKTSGDHLLDLINDILDFSKIEAGAMQLEHGGFSLREALESSLDVVKVAARNKNLALDYRLDPNVPDGIMGDAARLKQVLVNLLGNAIKFTDQGNITLRCWALVGDPLTIQFEVEDTGIGMTEEQISKLYKPFHQADATINRRFGGTGLGLSICKQLVNLMGGDMQVASDLGKGTCFSFSIQTEPATVSTTQLADPHGFLRGRKVQILALPENQTIIETHVLRWGMELVEDDPDVVIADYVEPTNQAMELAQSGMPIVIVTNRAHFRSNARPKTVIELVRPAKLTELHSGLLKLLGEADDGAWQSEFTDQFAAKYPLRILVAEDNPVNQKVISSMLQKLGYEPTLATNGEEAVAAAAEATFDVILMDVQMPVMDGFAATQAIRKLGATSRIIAATAHSDARVQEECLAAGMNDIMTKPIRLSSLAGVLSNDSTKEDSKLNEFIDLPRWNEMVDLMGDAMQEMLNTFETDVRESLSNLEADPKAHAHKIKGAALTLGFSALGRLAEDVELGRMEPDSNELEAALQDALSWASRRLR